MATTSPARIDDDLYASARLAGDVQSRSASQQVVHWARIGREIEASGTISYKDIVEVLAGSRRYDTLGVEEQAIVRAEWAARVDAIRDSLSLAEQFAATGRTWIELDAEGNVIESAGDGIAAEGRPSTKRGSPGHKRTRKKPGESSKVATKRSTASAKGKSRGRGTGTRAKR